MNYITCINIVIALLAIALCFIVWKIYKLTRAPSILIFLAAVCWAAVFRILVASIKIDATSWMLGYWVLSVIGMFALLRVLRKYIKG
jgi:hypothetical protein